MFVFSIQFYVNKKYENEIISQYLKKNKRFKLKLPFITFLQFQFKVKIYIQIPY